MVSPFLDVFLLIIFSSHPDKVLSRARHDDATSNLLRHVKLCPSVPSTDTAQLSVSMFAAGSTYSEQKLRLLLVKWCACNSRPMLIVDDDAFVEILQMLNAHVAIPSRQTVARDIKAVFEISQKHVKKYLAQLVSRIHGLLDGWSSPNVISVLGFAITFLNKDDEMFSIVLDCIRYFAVFSINPWALLISP